MNMKQAKSKKVVRENNSNAMVDATAAAVLKLRAARGCSCPLCVPASQCQCPKLVVVAK